MRSLALLRGINVGGKNKVDMATLRETFVRTGASNVLTYINSGNVIFDDERPHQELASLLEGGIDEDFGLRVKVLLRDITSIRGLVAAIPDSWTTDKTMRTNVIFLWEHVDSPEVVDQLPVRDGVDESMYSPGAIVWRYDTDKATRSGMGRLVGTDLYRAMTVRNSNTVRKLAFLMEEHQPG